MKRVPALLLHAIRRLPGTFDDEERRLVVQSVVVGVVVWAIVYPLKLGVHWLFDLTLHSLEQLGHGPQQLFVLAPLLVGALIVAGIARFHAVIVHYRDDEGVIHELNDVEGDGLERAIALYYTSEPAFERVLQGQEGLDVRWQMPTFSLALRKFAATLVTLGSGGSGGLEASVTLIGESSSAGLFKPRQPIARVNEKIGMVGRFWRWWQADDPDELQTAQLSGIAAAVAVLLGAPLTAAFFAIEVMYRQRPLIEKLAYTLISALVAYSLTDLVTVGHPVIFSVEQHYVPPTSPRYYAVVVLLATAVSLVSILFGRFRAFTDRLFHHRFADSRPRLLVGAAITGLIAFAVAIFTFEFDLWENGLELVLGTGDSVINAALAGELTLAVALLALAAKMPATLATVGSGGSAGLLVPSLFFGTMVASAFAILFDYEPMLLIVPGMTAALVSIVNVPLAAILFTVELFGSVYMVPALLTLVVTSILAHNRSIYRPQREKAAKRQIMPGVGSRRIAPPPSWWGKTLVELDLRRRYNVNVVGLMEFQDENGLPRVRLDTSSTVPLSDGDMLVVVGREEKLDALETAVRAEREVGWQEAVADALETEEP
ncbi:MAG TPA: chloride channel protein [Chloroflexota bacterium]|nr:chloride channel protein [Chloroflexota bacterium]HUM68660.1 chloride channel protein [Chloroflexota bacterium]